MCMQVNRTLTSINLTLNKLEEAAVMAIVDALKVCAAAVTYAGQFSVLVVD
jgi:hypothetical protein